MIKRKQGAAGENLPVFGVLFRVSNTQIPCKNIGEFLNSTKFRACGA